jgi:hypothetical protein
MKDIRIERVARREDPFARIPKTLLDDATLSWKAKGVLAYLMSKPDHWHLRLSDIIKHATEGESAVRSALKELRKAGYADLCKIRSAGRFKEWVWKVSDSPVYQEFTKKSPDGDFPQVENPHVENRHISKKESSKTDFRKKKSKEPKASANAGASAVADFPAEWKPKSATKEQKLAAIPTPRDYPDEAEFDEFLSENALDSIIEHRPDLYNTLCTEKWHLWKEQLRKWAPIRNWQAFVTGLNSKIGDAYFG